MTAVSTSPNAWTVTTDTGTPIGTIIFDAKGFTAISAAGAIIGRYQTMAAATGALGG